MLQLARAIGGGVLGEDAFARGPGDPAQLGVGRIERGERFRRAPGEQATAEPLIIPRRG